MSLSIIIPVGYDPDGLEITLSSIFKSKSLTNIPIEIIVINDGYDLEVEKICLKYKIVHYPTTINIGPAAGRNIGIELSKYNYIAFIDADIKVSDHWIELMHYSLTKYHYVGGKILIDRENISNIFEEYDYITAFDVQSYMEKGHAPTANLGIRKEITHKVGLFEPNLRSGEDTEFGDRVFKHKDFVFFYNEEAVVFHPPRSLKSQLIKRARVVKGHLKLASIYKDRYKHFKKTYYNPFIMLRPPFQVFKKIANSKKISTPTKFILYTYAYFLKLYSFSIAIKYMMKPTTVNLETKNHPKIDQGT
ncbi:glycosyltransferase family 2 protein [Nitrincola nitratireducens]|uniref:Hyaluronan synthase n=1 Tax=Nitrincola nitratireducens TaxID=1229521 RepID=W9UPL3_9GAMM|nr:glycosyltransferase family A protein [Nitrincola nitratireducens]EXJ09034.1 Hyaluronan synthase [Nitrincola nitratireducens]